MERPMIVPMPPVAKECALPWDAPLADPVRALADARRLLGDTFVVDSGEDRYLFTFAPVGVHSFYALAEETASKGVADWRMLRRKLPDEVFVGRRTLPHQLFGREDVTRYLAMSIKPSTTRSPSSATGHDRRVRVDPTARSPGGPCLVGWPRRGHRHPV